MGATAKSFLISVLVGLFFISNACLVAHGYGADAELSSFEPSTGPDVLQMNRTDDKSQAHL